MLLQSVATVAAALLAAPAAVLGAAHPAAVFAFPKSDASAHTRDIPALRPAEARLVFAERLGVSRFHKLGYEGQDMKVLELNRFSGEHTGLWREKNDNIVVVVSGFTTPKDVFTESRPAFVISDAPDAASFRSLATGFVREAQQLVGDLGVRVFGDSKDSFVTVVPDVDLCLNGHEEHISRSQCESVSETCVHADFTAAFGADFAEYFDAGNAVDAVFMDEALALSAFIDGYAQSVRSDSQLAVLFFNGLGAMLDNFGAESAKYQVAAAIFTNLLERLVRETASSTPITAVLVPGGLQPAKSSSKKTKRSQKVSADAFGNQHVSPAVSIGILAESTSYTTQEECEIMTNYCSGGHGVCMQMYGQEGYYGCQCISTYDETTRQRTYWAGDYCQKYDVTVPFQIFFWGLIVTVLFVAWIISAMISMGSQELPAVLGAATMVQTKA
ncbi:uncharacterized protein V1518DRAFT_413432 [Limtongia smithiae]|uniref:uncharacterized protein n=1 Tax=Limtongia smithiae TaxID=1125753 RepID=UPI0034CF4231